MNRGIATLADVLPKGFFIAEKQPEKPIREPVRVIGDPTRAPVNRQAAMMMAKSNWLTAPMPPDPDKTLERERLISDNKKLIAKNEFLISENKSLKIKIKRLEKICDSKRPVVKIVTPNTVIAEPPKKKFFEKLMECT